MYLPLRRFLISGVVENLGFPDGRENGLVQLQPFHKSVAIFAAGKDIAALNNMMGSDESALTGMLSSVTVVIGDTVRCQQNKKY